MVSTKIRLIIFFAAKDGEALYSRQKQDQELIVSQIMNSLLQNKIKLKKAVKPLVPQVLPKSNPLQLYSGSDKFKGLGLIECLKNYGERFMTLYRRW